MGKLGIVDWREDCSSCHNCVKRGCVYGLYRDEADTLRDEIGYLDYIYQCKGCLSCVQNCTKNILTRVVNPEYRRLGDDYFTPDIILSTWFQAETGRIPVSGSGYGGPFSGPGFDSMWTDMSEIVRPTRDGIHGREYISTSVDIGRKLPHLAFADGQLAVDAAAAGGDPAAGDLRLHSRALAARAGDGPRSRRRPRRSARWPWSCADGGLREHDAAEHGHVDPVAGDSGRRRRQRARRIGAAGDDRRQPRRDGGAGRAEAAESRPDRGDSRRRPRRPRPDAWWSWPGDGAEVIHLVFDSARAGGAARRQARATCPRRAARGPHARWSRQGIRDEVTLIASGGIALAEHMAKAIICGADLVAIDIPLLVALECRLCGECEHGRAVPDRLGGDRRRITPSSASST